MSKIDLANKLRSQEGTKPIDYFEDRGIRPVDDLNALRGPNRFVRLPLHLDWTPHIGTAFDLEKASDLDACYIALLSDGTVEDIEKYVCRDRLVNAWPRLVRKLPPKIKSMWELRFPQELGSCDG